MFPLRCFLLILTLVNASSQSAIPPRGFEWALVSIWTTNPYWRALFGGTPPCDEFYTESGDQVIYGTDWQACYAPGEYLWLQDDTNLANCLIDLHYQHNFACISTVGSSCENSTGTSKILDSNELRIGSYQLSALDAKLMKEATQSLVNHSVDSSQGRNWPVGVVGVAEAANTWVMSFRFGGERQC